LEQERSLRALPPLVIGGALVIPKGMIDVARGDAQPAAMKTTEEIERIAIEATMAVESRLGRTPIDMNALHKNNPGFDIKSTDCEKNVWFIEVKGRIEGSDAFSVTRNEMLTGLNKPDRYILSMVEVSHDGNPDVRYLTNPFADVST